MTRGHQLVAALITSFGCLLAAATTAHAQQQFGPSPQAMYKQHPGSAPTFVNYGVSNPSAKVATAQPAPSSTLRTMPRPAARPATHSTVTAAAKRRTTATTTATAGR